MAYYQIEPWGDERADLRSGIVAAMIYNANKGKKGKAAQPTDFLIKTKPREEKDKKQSTKEQKRIVKMLHAAFGGVFKESE